MMQPYPIRQWSTFKSPDDKLRVEVFYNEAGLIESVLVTTRRHSGDSWGPTTLVEKVA